jgi:hypothetical protein
MKKLKLRKAKWLSFQTEVTKWPHPFSNTNALGLSHWIYTRNIIHAHRHWYMYVCMSLCMCICQEYSFSRVSNLLLELCPMTLWAQLSKSIRCGLRVIYSTGNAASHSNLEHIKGASYTMFLANTLQSSRKNNEYLKGVKQKLLMYIWKHAQCRIQIINSKGLRSSDMFFSFDFPKHTSKAM